jgi:hypothetical protein
VVVPDAEVVRLVREAANAQRDKIAEKGYGYSGPFTGSLRKVDELKFAPPDAVVKATEAAFAEILGDKTADNTKKSKTEREAPQGVTPPSSPHTTHTHARTHARTHAHTHTSLLSGHPHALYSSF